MTALDFDLRGMNVYLIGMMGVGKSTVGRLLAQKLGYGFCDSDDVIEAAAQCSIPDIFAASGETGFRDLETQVLGQLTAHKQLVVATGGGIVLRRNNWGHLRQGLVIWLDAPFGVLWQRLHTDRRRPLLQTESPQQTLKTLMAERQPLYALADIQVPIGFKDRPEAIANSIVATIPSKLKAPPQRLEFTPDTPSINE